MQRNVREIISPRTHFSVNFCLALFQGLAQLSKSVDTWYSRFKPFLQQQIMVSNTDCTTDYDKYRYTQTNRETSEFEVQKFAALSKTAIEQKVELKLTRKILTGFFQCLQAIRPPDCLLEKKIWCTIEFLKLVRKLI